MNLADKKPAIEQQKPAYRSSGFYCSRTHITPEYKNMYSYHWHDYYEIEFVIGGAGFHRLNNTAFTPVKRGDVYLLTPADFHDIVTDGDLWAFTMNFNNNILDSETVALLQTHHALTCTFSEKEISYLEQELLRLQEEVDGGRAMKSKIITYAFNHILMIFLRKCIEQNHSLTNNACPFKLQEAIAYTLNNYNKDISINDVARHVGVNPDYLGRLFRQNIETTFPEYVRQLRLIQSVHLLETKEQPIETISEEVGFNSPSYFIKLFKETYGITPSKYRKGLLSDEEMQMRASHNLSPSLKNSLT